MFSCGQVEHIPARLVDCSSQRGVGRLARSSTGYLAPPHSAALTMCSIREELEYIAGQGTRGEDSTHDAKGKPFSLLDNGFLGKEQPHRLHIL